MSEYSSGPAMWQAIAAVVIFGAAYAGIVIERWNRSYIAIGGAVLMAVLGIVPVGEAFSTFAEWDTLIWIGSLFIISICVQRTGIIAYFSTALIRKYRVKPFSILLGLSVLTAAFSALVDSLAAIIIVVPLMLGMCKALKLSPTPFLLSAILSANLGGAATTIGTPATRIIGEAAGFTLWQFMKALGPLVLILLVIVYAAVWLLYGRSMVVPESQKRELLGLQPAEYLKDRTQTVGGGAILLLFLLLELFQGLLGWHSSYIALGAAAAFTALNYKDVAGLVRGKDYRSLGRGLLDSQLLYFFGLFVMSGALAYSGISGWLAIRGMEASQGSIPFLSMVILWVGGVGSAMIDHVPFVAALTHVLGAAGTLEQAPSSPLWWALAIGTAIGGSGTIVGSTAGMFAVGLAMQERSGFALRDYLKFAAPVCLVLLAVAALYMSVFLL